MSDLDFFQLIPLIRKQIARDRSGFWSVEENGIEFHPVVENVSFKSTNCEQQLSMKGQPGFPHNLWLACFFFQL